MNKVIIAITLAGAAWLAYETQEDCVILKSLYSAPLDKMKAQSQKVKPDHLLFAAYSSDILRKWKGAEYDNAFWLGRFSSEMLIKWNGLYEANSHRIVETPNVKFETLASQLNITFSVNTINPALLTKLLMSWQEFQPNIYVNISTLLTN